MKIRIASRQSPLALYQAEFFAKMLKGIKTEIIKIKSEGDMTSQPLHKIGGKGLFVNCLEEALKKDEADIAVHSLKDVPAKLNKSFEIAGVLDRESPLDLFISKENLKLNQLPEGSTILTSSPRRRAQLLNIRQDLIIKPVRGNIETRIKKAKADADGLIVAEAAINRLGISLDSFERLSIKKMLPAASQGFIGLECLKDNVAMKKVISSVTSKKNLLIAESERKFVKSLNGDCLSPICILVREYKKRIAIVAKVFSKNGSLSIQKETSCSIEEIFDEIDSLSSFFIKEGAMEIIRS